MCMVHLQDYKDTYLSLVTPDVFKWINRPYTPPQEQDSEYSYEEEVPQSIRAGYLKEYGCTTCTITRGSSDNDRALAVWFLGKKFESVAALRRYAKSHNVRIVDEYYGYSY